MTSDVVNNQCGENGLVLVLDIGYGTMWHVFHCNFIWCYYQTELVIREFDS